MTHTSTAPTRVRGARRVSRRYPWLALLVLLLFAGPSLAHHSFAMYDSEKLLQLEGTVKEFQWTNPHAIVWVTGSTDPAQAPELWTVELPTSPGNLSRMGWKRNSLSPGDRVIVEINPLRDGRHGGSFKKATLTSTGVVLVANVRDEPPTGAAGADTHADDDHDHDHDEKSSCALRGSAAPSGAPLLILCGGCLALGAVRRRTGSRARTSPSSPSPLPQRSHWLHQYSAGYAAAQANTKRFNPNRSHAPR